MAVPGADELVEQAGASDGGGAGAMHGAAALGAVALSAARLTMPQPLYVSANGVTATLLGGEPLRWGGHDAQIGVPHGARARCMRGMMRARMCPFEHQVAPLMLACARRRGFQRPAGALPLQRMRPRGPRHLACAGAVRRRGVRRRSWRRGQLHTPAVRLGTACAA